MAITSKAHPEGGATDLKTGLCLGDVPDNERKLICKIASKHLNDPRFDSDWQAVQHQGYDLGMELYANFGAEALKVVDELGINGRDFALLRESLNSRLPTEKQMSNLDFYEYLKTKQPMDVIIMLRVIKGSSYYFALIAGQEDEQTQEAAEAKAADLIDDDERGDHARNIWPN